MLAVLVWTGTRNTPCLVPRAELFGRPPAHYEAQDLRLARDGDEIEQAASAGKASSSTSTGVTPPQQQGQGQTQQSSDQPQGEELGSGDFSSLNTKFTHEDGNRKKTARAATGHDAAED
ncbi:hypothetical protein pipiens_015665 [Culex pipiens pipiens]|uniref:Uncharacterized protein n=1 Tax=Culex pipiens pipiens TaxID=38569 RepID=A0ABD1CPI6_CULPP